MVSKLLDITQNLKNVFYSFKLSFVLSAYLPSATVGVERQCFHKCLLFCPQEGVYTPFPKADTLPGQTPSCADTFPSPRQIPPHWADMSPPTLTPRGGHCSRRYASYWNAFLFPLCKRFYNKNSSFVPWFP